MLYVHTKCTAHALHAIIVATHGTECASVDTQRFGVVIVPKRALQTLTSSINWFTRVSALLIAAKMSPLSMSPPAEVFLNFIMSSMSFFPKLCLRHVLRKIDGRLCNAIREVRNFLASLRHLLGDFYRRLQPIFLFDERCKVKPKTTL